jgi:hypothetical protein
VTGVQTCALPISKDNSGHQGGRKENFRKTDKKGNFKLYIMNSGEYEFIVLGKGSVKKQIENIIDNDNDNRYHYLI